MMPIIPKILVGIYESQKISSESRGVRLKRGLIKDKEEFGGSLFVFCEKNFGHKFIDTFSFLPMSAFSPLGASSLECGEKVEMTSLNKDAMAFCIIKDSLVSVAYDCFYAVFYVFRQ